ncbi:MAG: hypothetical protein K8R77_06530, partial [Anaerolineaceae bacterium]|nr:hypothetical protein [Anaerolineaceae bacterium]
MNLRSSARRIKRRLHSALFNPWLCLWHDLDVGSNCRFGNSRIVIRTNNGPIRIGKNCVINAVQLDGTLIVGDNVLINTGSHVVGAKEAVTIGNDVLIGPNVIIMSGQHQHRNPEVKIRLQGVVVSPVNIEDDVWIGAGAVILPG